MKLKGHMQLMGLKSQLNMNHSFQMKWIKCFSTKDCLVKLRLKFSLVQPVPYIKGTSLSFHFFFFCVRQICRLKVEDRGASVNELEKTAKMEGRLDDVSRQTTFIY